MTIPTASNAHAGAVRQSKTSKKISRLRIVVLAVGVLGGLGQGVVWGSIAPQQRWVIYPQEPVPLSLPTESTHRFTAMGMYGILSIVLGVVMAVATWQIRRARGVSMLVTVVAAVGCGSAIALLIGEWMLGGILPAVRAEAQVVTTPEMVTMKPGVSWLLIAIAPAAAAAVYSLLAVWHPDKDLGNPAPAAPIGPVPTAATSAVPAFENVSVSEPIPNVPSPPPLGEFRRPGVD